MFPSPFDQNVAFVALSATARSDFPLHPDEARILSPHASQKRRAEFSLGRAAAHLALKQLGIDRPPPVLQGENRDPLWPEGVVGSITHCEQWAMAAAAPRSVAMVMGIDLESISTMQREDIRHLICHEAERNWVAREPDWRERTVTFFSAKEAVFKAFYPLCKRWIDFTEVSLSPLPGVQRFFGELPTPLMLGLKPGARFEVGWRRKGDLILTYVVPNSLSTSATPLPCPGDGSPS